MTAAELETWVRAVPFQPFEIVTGDGQRFPVPTPDHISIAPSKRIVGVWWDGGGLSAIDMFLITFIESRRRRKASRRGVKRR